MKKKCDLQTYRPTDMQTDIHTDKEKKYLIILKYHTLLPRDGCGIYVSIVRYCIFIYMYVTMDMSYHEFFCYTLDTKYDPCSLKHPER